MSLILDALRKVEREKGAATPRGFLVIGGGGAHDGGGSRLGRLAAALALVVGVGVGVALWRQSGPEAPPASEAPTPESAAPTAASPVEVVPAPGHAVAAQPLAAAPVANEPATAAAVAEPAAPPTLRLQAISRRDGRPVAILNDRLVREGDRFDGVSVIRIGELEVEVEANGQRVVLSF